MKKSRFTEEQIVTMVRISSLTSIPLLRSMTLSPCLEVAENEHVHLV